MLNYFNFSFSDLKGIKTLYVITDVVLVNQVTLLVKMGNTTANFSYDRDMPIGFKYKKYRLHSDGTFLTEVCFWIYNTFFLSLFVRSYTFHLIPVWHWTSKTIMYGQERTLISLFILEFNRVFFLSLIKVNKKRNIRFLYNLF